MLNDWVSTKQLPVIAVGDYNFDWSVNTGDSDHDEGYDNITANNAFQWVRPVTLYKTQDSGFNSILDFIFVSAEAQNWAVSSTILKESNDFPDTDKTSDHRPVQALFDLSKGEMVTKQEIIAKIEALSRELENLKRMVTHLH